MTTEFEYFQNKRTDRVYLSRRLEARAAKKLPDGEIQEFKRPFRIVSKVIQSSESHEFFRDGKQVSLRVSAGQKQEIKATFYEDNRGISTLQIQKFTVESGAPHKTYFSFVGNEISILRNFLDNIEFLPTENESSAKLDDAFVERLVLTKEQALSVLEQYPDLVKELQSSNISAEDVANIGYRKSELEEFKRLLHDEDHFLLRQQELAVGKGPEAVWQAFFERNTWIFGYGLNYCLNTPLEDQKLEQIVKGHDFASSGKRVDALLKTQGLISALSFGEIKTHKAKLLKKTANPYRADCWQVSDDVTGGVSQVQKSVHSSLRNIQSKTAITDESGSPTGEQVFLFQPKSFLVIGSLEEFQTEHGINEQKYSSFELFRRHMSAPEIITFDELYERAKFIVEAGKN